MLVLAYVETSVCPVNRPRTSSMPNSALICCSGALNRVMVTVVESSTTILPPSSRISSRSVPVRSWVHVVNVPVAPSPKSTSAVTSSSTAMSRLNPKAHLAKTEVGTPHSHCHRSS